MPMGLGDGVAVLWSGLGKAAKALDDAGVGAVPGAAGGKAPKLSKPPPPNPPPPLPKPRPSPLPPNPPPVLVLVLGAGGNGFGDGAVATAGAVDEANGLAAGAAAGA